MGPTAELLAARSPWPPKAELQADGLPTGGLLHSPHHGDPWRDPGLLGVPDPTLTLASTAPLSFRAFIAEAYPRYGFHRWALVLIALLQAIADGQLSRLIVTCPPRLGKSLLVSKLFPAYFIYRHPHLFAAIASYSGELAYAHSREARHFYRVTGNQLSKDSAAVGNWLTTQRGGCIAAGVDGPFTGKGYSLGVIDDPYKGPADAGSARVRSRIEDWLKAVWFTRAEPQFTDAGDGALQHNLSAQVIVLTRWDHEDVIGWLLAQETGDAPQDWHILNLPAIAEHPADRLSFPASCTLEPDWRAPGEALCPERFPLSELLKIRSRVGSFWWNALYQQRPSPATGSIFQRAWIRPPFPREHQRRYAPLVLSCDLSFKGEEQNDHCGFVLMGLLLPDALQPTVLAQAAGPLAPQLELEVIWAARHHFDLPQTIRFLLSTLAALDAQGLRPQAVLIEDAANGPAVQQSLKRKVPGLLPIPARGSKESRAHAVSPLLEAGQVRFHHRAAPLVEELPRFPKGTKDLVDAFGHGALWLETRYWRGLGIKRDPLPMLLTR
ncbi:terminase [Synechococcus sp. Cruz-9H2]|uniref:phage terminase large subunit family protein n=1 Tax=unclassified Synechococcus TaxID=2626047 RepID=UPI0020CD9485|nr:MULTISPECIES: terminase [unclassified Synechococcus]MCP9820257.1 terminase [Synechococcus sp. Cruz-9H2]MCP9844502.1 terminase [Synechococcus sp. Edmonson 11F2]MCP9856687.1 terminase [Synechococcus sp. Cruz-9C9]MCP9863973.1 terminase [Synechococcus sp. Cruz-7E5]MCP9871106.1 terminase [Synechococcus sp. Cruz-7B9]